MANDSPETLLVPAVTPKVKAARVLPTPRIQAETQFMGLRAYGATSGPERNAVSNSEVAKVANLSESSISLCNPFWVDIGLLTREGVRQRPHEAVVDYHQAQQWDAETAGRKLAPVIAQTWFWKVLAAKVAFRALTRDEAIAFLADEAKATTAHRPQLETLLEYLRIAGLIALEGNTISKPSAEVFMGTVTADPAPAAAPAGGAARGRYLDQEDDEGMQVFQIPLPDKAPARISVPKDLDADDWEMLLAMMKSYIQRWKKFEQGP